MPEQQPKIKIENEPGKKEGFSPETKKTISNTLTEFENGIETEARQKLLTDYEKNKDIPQGTKEKISQLKKEKKDDGTIFKEIDGWGFLGKEGERNKRKGRVLETASKIDIDKLSPQAKKLILGDLNSEAEYLNLLHKETKDPAKKKELESKINSLKGARKELAGNITGEDPKKTEEEITKKVTSERRTLEEDMVSKKISITNKEKEFREITKNPKRTSDDEVKLAKMRSELDDLRKDVKIKEATLKQDNVSIILEGKLQEIGVLNENELKKAEDEILKEKPEEERRQGKIEDERRVRRLPVRVEEENVFGEVLGKKIGAYERGSLKKYELSMKEKGAVAGQLGRMSKDMMEDFDLKWYVENRDKVEEANFKFNPSNMEHVKMAVARLGGHNEINQYRPESLTGEELPTYLEKLKQIEALEKDLYKEFVPPDSQALIFNLLQKRAERIKGKIGEAEGSAKKALKKEDKELFEVRKILGKNTTKMFSGEEMKGFWLGTDYPLSEVYPAIGREIISGGKASWNEKMEALAGDLDVAIGFTEAKYAAVKDRVVTEVIEKELKKEKKSGPVLEAIERGFRGMGRDYIPFIDKIVHRRGLEGLTGGWEEDKRLLGDFLEAEGITDFSAERFDASKAALESRRMPYEKAVKQQKGFVDWLLSFIFQFLSSPEAERR